MMDWLNKALGMFQVRKIDGAIAAPKDVYLYNSELFNAAPDRMRCAVSLFEPAALVHYVLAHGIDGVTSVFVEPHGSPAALAVLNFGHLKEPLWQDHIAAFEPVETPLFAALNQLMGQVPTGQCGQQALLDFMDDYGHALRFERNGAAVPLVEARAKWADMTVEKVNRARSNRAEAFDRELSATEKLSLGLDLPTLMSFEDPLFLGFSSQRVQVALRAASASSALAVELRIQGYKALLDNVRSELHEALEDATSRVYVGRFDTSAREIARNQ